MLSVEMTHKLPDLALDVRFLAPEGITVLFGRSGTGKTTVVNAVAGLLRPQTGRVVLGDRVLCDTARGVWVPPHRRRIGYVFQEDRLFPHLSVEQNIHFGRRFSPTPMGRGEISRIVDMLGLGTLLHRRPGALSGGEKQRVAIGRALVSHPLAILADEPLAALDEARKAEILPYFERLRDELRIPVLYVSHAPTEVARLATTVVALQDGQVIRQGSAAEVLSDPDVMPAGPQSVGAVIEARVVAHHDDGLTELAAGEARFFVPRANSAPGDQVRLRIAAHDVMLSLRAPEQISALNIVAGHVRSIRYGSGPGAIVVLDSTAGPILARVTKRSLAALNLQQGTPAHAVIKTVAIAPGAVGGGALRGPK